jgi:autotransporter-associated beta strand protein
VKSLLQIASVVVALSFAMGTNASAQLTWGTNGSGGSGTWNNITPNWYNGASNTDWVSGDTGTFTNSSGTVTISGTQTASQLTFSSGTSGTYLLTGGALGISTGSSNLTVETDSDAIINSNINNLGATGTLTKTGTSTLTLGGSNTYSTLAITSGTVYVPAPTSPSVIIQPVGNGGNIVLGVAGTSSGTFYYAGNNSAGYSVLNAKFTANGNGADTITLGGTADLFVTGTTTINAPSLTISSSITLVGGPSGYASAGGISFDAPILAAAGSVLNLYAGAVLGAANSTIQTINVYRVSPTQNVGVGLSVTVNNALPSNVSINLNYGTLGIGSNSGTVVTLTVGNLSGGTNSLIYNVFGTATATLVLNNTQDDTFGGFIGDPAHYGDLALIKENTGTLTLTRNNDYTEGTTIDAGAIVISYGTTDSSGTIEEGGLGSGLITINDGGMLEDNGTAITLANDIAVSGTVTFASTGSGSFTFDGTTMLISPSRFQINGNTNLVTNENITIADSVSNSGNYNLIKSGSGTLSLTSAGTGSTTVAAGTLATNNPTNLGSGTINLSGGTTFQYISTSSGTFFQNIAVTSGTAVLSSAASGGVTTLAGTVSVDGSTLTITGTGTALTDFVINGAIIGSSPNSNINYIGHTTVGLTTASTYTGSSSISGGSTLLAGVDNALPDGTALVFGAVGESGKANRLDLLGHSITVSSLATLGSDTNIIVSSSGSATTPLSTTLSSTTTGNLTVNLASGTDIFSGSLGLGGASNLSLTKSGAGTLILSSNLNRYTGGTLVTDGALTLSNTSGSATGSGTISVSSGAALTGSGTITSTNIAINGNLQPGTGGTDTTGIMTLTSTSAASFTSANLVFNLNAATPGQSTELALKATPSVLFTTTTLTLDLQNNGTIPDGSQYTLITSTGTGTGIGGSIFGGISPTTPAPESSRDWALMIPPVTTVLISNWSPMAAVTTSM